MKLFIGNITPDYITLKEEEAHHIIKVLRMASGEDVYVTDGLGRLVQGKLLLKGKKVEIEVLKTFPKEEPADNSLHIAIAPTKNIDRFEFFLEKVVELGIAEITPLLCANSERKILKIDKLQKQIESACKQSLRPLFPIINPLTSFNDFVKQENGKIFITHCYSEYAKTPINNILPQQGRITIFIGPEGDFSKKEVNDLYNLGASGVSLGNNRLRTETAGIFTVAAYKYSTLI